MAITVPPLVYQLTTTLEHVLFPEINPNFEEYLKVSDIHTIWYAEYGNPQGMPIIFSHGGPGFSCSPIDMRFFDPNFYRIILCDQRGSGRSTPFSEMVDNTTQDLINDMEKIRAHLGIDKWVLFGGSWGSALSIAYGESHPDRCLGFVLRGVFLGRTSEINQLWHGMGDHFPEVFEEYVNFLPKAERSDLIVSFHNRFHHPDPQVHMPAARALMKYDFICSRVFTPSLDILKNDNVVLGVARTFSHYSVNKCFIEEGQLLSNLHKISHLPSIIVHGRFDLICRPSAAYELYKSWPDSELVFVQDAGHASAEPGIAKELVAATEKMKLLI